MLHHIGEAFLSDAIQTSRHGLRDHVRVTSTSSEISSVERIAQSSTSRCSATEVPKSSRIDGWN